ncbi:MAG: TPM domain-containing protein, partial [Ruminococcus sp.]|nr:TPM domain-containing protein [Ruminococcus sp.]
LKTVAMQRGAASYVRSGSMNVTQSRDTYLYSTVSRTRREKSSSGSSTHSTGGSSFGGSGGKF